MRILLIAILCLTFACSKDAMLSESTLPNEHLTSHSFQGVEVQLMNGLMIFSDDKHLMNFAEAMIEDYSSAQSFIEQLPGFTSMEQQYNTEVDKVLALGLTNRLGDSKAAFIDDSRATPMVLRTVSNPIFENILNQEAAVQIGEQVYYFTMDHQFIIDAPLWEERSTAIKLNPEDFINQGVTKSKNPYNRQPEDHLKATAGSCAQSAPSGTGSIDVQVEGKIRYDRIFNLRYSYLETKGYIKYNGLLINADFDLRHIGTTFVIVGSLCIPALAEVDDTATSTKKLTSFYDQRTNATSTYRPAGNNDIKHRILLNGQTFVECISQTLPC